MLKPWQFKNHVTERCQFMRGNFRLLLFWPFVGLAAIAATWAFHFDNLKEQKLDADNTALTDAGTMARNYAAHLKRTIGTIDQLLIFFKLQWESTNGKLYLETFKERGLFPSSTPFNASIVDRNGIRQTSTFNTSSVPSAPNVSDRAYFLAQKSAKEDFLFISPPTIGRTTGNQVLQYSRRLMDSNGNFDGVILVTVETEFFTANYDALVLGKQGFMGAVGMDGQVRVARTGDKIQPSEARPLLTTAQFFLMSGSALLDGAKTFEDKRTRYVGWQPVDGYPIVAIVGIDEAEWLTPYYLAGSTARINAIGVTLAILIFTLVAVTLSSRLAWRKYQLEMLQLTYRKATEGGSEGFYISRPMRDASGKIVDFQAIDCNERGAAFFQLTRDEFVGRKLSHLQDRSTFYESWTMLVKAMDTGKYEGELILNSRRGRKRYLHVRALKSDNDLAVTLRDITQEKEQLAQLEQRTNEDSLTGIPNRLWANAYLPKAVEFASESGTLLAVLFIDLDGFKTVNDTLGHTAGDEVLRNAAYRLKEAVRPHDHVVRLGGDEFIVILENITSEADAAHVAERIIQAFHEVFRVPQGTASIGTSIGISVFPNDAKDADALLQNADIAMYAVKTRGKHHYEFFSTSLSDALHNRLRKEAELRTAIEKDQFVMYYQIRVDVLTGRTSSMEALVRWRHPRDGIVEPLNFIPLAEETGLILPLGELIIHKVCEQLARWKLHGGPLVPVSINISSRQFNETDIAEILVASIEKNSIDALLVEVELTESTVMDDTPQVESSLKVLHDLGIKLLVDDFGTGYSSLAKLQELDCDILKIDKSFTKRLGQSAQGPVFFSAIITMAHALGIRVVAEGVEERSQLEMLKKMQCDEIQGFYVGMPSEATQSQASLYKQLEITLG